MKPVRLVAGVPLLTVALMCQSVNADDGTGHLRTLGVAESLIGLYRCVLSLEPCRVADVVAATGGEPTATASAVSDLAEVGLVHHGADGWVRAVYPGSALQRLAARRTAEIDFAHLAVLDWVAGQRRVEPVPALEAMVEVLPHRDVPDQVAHLERRVRAQVRILDSPPYHVHGEVDVGDAGEAAPASGREDGHATSERPAGTAPADVETDNLRRGVRYRVVYAASSLDRPGAVARVLAPYLRRGEQARTLASVPVKLMIFDDRLAVLGVAGAQAGQQPVLLVRPSSLLDACEQLFEHIWRTALPLDTQGRMARSVLGPDDRRLLSLLAGGSSDERIARALGVSRRTFFRRLERLMNLAGARTRFQLAVCAAREQWI